jgi:hypothetical protein
MRERRASNALVVPGAVGTVFSGWSKSSALDKAITEARTKAAAAPQAHRLCHGGVYYLRRTVATGLHLKWESGAATSAAAAAALPVCTNGTIGRRRSAARSTLGPLTCWQ